MTEDDTFNKLRQVPFDSMTESMMNNSETVRVFEKWNIDEISIIRKYGWSELEFKKYLLRVEYEGDRELIREIRRLEELQNDRG